ncbi:hypothetical protein ACLOJK_003966 [Asimina triloba]
MGQRCHRRQAPARHVARYYVSIFESSFEDNQGKGKAPNTSGEAGVAQSRARRAPTNVNKLDQRAVADVAAFVMTLEEKQTSQDVEMTFLRRKLEAMQIQPTETPSTPLEKRKAETSPDVLEQLRREAEIPQPVPRRRFKVAVSKRATYPDSEDREPVKEIPPHEEGPKEPPLAPESFGETSSTIPNPPPPIPEKNILAVDVESSSPATPKSPSVESTFVKVPPQRHQAKDCLYEMVCNGCKEPGHLARECSKRRKRD